LGWFGAGVMSEQPVNLFNFGEGNLKFMIKIPANVTFQIGIIDAWGNQSYVEFPANQTKYGLVRNGDWGQATIPIEDIRGEFIDLRMLSYEFVILEVNGNQCEFALDDIYWEGGIEDIQENEKDIFIFQNNFPNPFSTSTTFNYSLDETSNIEIAVYDISGRIVETLINEVQNSGAHSVIWNVSESKSGIYFCKIIAGEYSDVRKCVLSR